MTALSELVQDVETTALTGGDVAVTGIAYRADEVRPGDAFFCIRGMTHDGHDFADEAVRRGASALVTSRPLDFDIAQAVVTDVRIALALGAGRFFGQPSRALDVVGITGTNGKTTTAYLVESIARAAGRTTGLIGTVETRIAEARTSAGRTTPESADLQALFARMRDAGVEVAAVEVSSHAIDLQRVAGVRFAVAAFTNLTQDHLDYHHTIEEYWSVKRRLFVEADVGVRVVNVDDPYGAGLADETGAEWTVGRAEGARVRAVDERSDPGATVFTLLTPGGEARVTLPLAGAYNVSNALVAAGSALALGIDLATIVEGLERAPQVPGRLERIDAGQPFSVYVDYAHTPDSLAKALAAVKATTEGRLIVVFGCGGDRDPEKRPLMGHAAAAVADEIVLTSDNPRSEDPARIIRDVEEGLHGTDSRHVVEIDRRTAIARALAMAGVGDAVLIAGKGHEDYQIFADHTIHFDDRETAREELMQLC